MSPMWCTALQKMYTSNRLTLNTVRCGNSAGDGGIGEYLTGTRVPPPPTPLTRIHAVKIDIALL